MEQIRKFTEGFFRNLKCEVSWDDEILVVENVPKSFEDLFGKAGPYNLTFSNCGSRESVVGSRDVEFVGKGSRMMLSMTKYLEGAGKATLLKIDFKIDAEAEIRKHLSLKNCELTSLTKGYRNSFFSRFSFVTSFSYLNESERLLNEVYVHNGEVVDGDLSGYSVVDGDTLSGHENLQAGNLVMDSEKVKRDYAIAKVRSVELSKGKQDEVAGILKEKVEMEVSRIEAHYDKQLKELGGDLNGKLTKIREVELALRSCEDNDRDELRKRLERLRGGLVKAGDDETAVRVLKEKDMTIRDVMLKYSLNVGRKLVNTTVIYYPVYTFKIFLEGDNAKKFIEVSYDPLTRSFSGLDCEGCSKKLSRISLCEGGHICCDDCLDRCGECAKVFCSKCLRRSCHVCGRKLCKGCVKMCLGCGCSVCATHLRKDCVSGEERCVSCLRACLRCHGMCEEKFFGEAMDGSKVCSKCLGSEKRGDVLERVFNSDSY